MKRLLVLTIAATLLFSGCSVDEEISRESTVVTEATTRRSITISMDNIPSYDELLQNRGEMLTATYANRGEMTDDYDCLISATYVVNYDGTIDISTNNTVSGMVAGSFELTEEEYMNCYILGVNGINSVGSVSNSDLGPDQSAYTYHFNDGNSTQYDFMSGYCEINGETFQFTDVTRHYEEMLFQ
ncbi:MAG: hypothetical protein MJ094_01085 [Saccharofermentans sp.]|nr:hypothetical protein [Saccharofermentans sp.]